MQDFLQSTSSNSHPEPGGGASGVTVATRQVATKEVEKEVQLRILLPDKTVTTVTINEFWRTNEVYDVS